MTYIELQDTFRNNPKVERLARTLGIRNAEARGLLTGLWTTLLVQAVDGDVTDLEPYEVEKWADWEGEEGALYAALLDERPDGKKPRHRFIERKNGLLVIHDWEEHTKGIARAAYMREYRRNKAADTRNVTRDHAERTCDVPSDPIRSDPSGPDPTEREERADAPSLPHEPDSPDPTRTDLAPETPSVPSVAPAVSTPAERSADAPGAKPGASHAIPRAPLTPDLSEDAFGVDEVIALYNAHRPPALPAHERDPTNTRFVRDLVEVIRADKRVAASERAAGRELPRPGLHTQAGWLGFTQRLHLAKSLPGWNPAPSLTRWVAGAAGDRMRADLWRGAYDTPRENRGAAALPSVQSADRSAEAQKRRRDEADRQREEDRAKIKPSRGIPAEVRAKMSAAGFGRPVAPPERIPGDDSAGE